jgi:hypothetical protein
MPFDVKLTLSRLLSCAEPLHTLTTGLRYASLASTAEVSGAA